MCGSMVDIQSATDEIRRGKKEEETMGRMQCWEMRDWQMYTVCQKTYTFLFFE